MINNITFSFDDYANQKNECINLLSKYLNHGHLGLMLGAGASKDLGMPKWETLVVELCMEFVPDKLSRVSGYKYSSYELKQLTDNVKQKINDDHSYFSAVKKILYKDVGFDFSTAKKELLIALSSLIIGKRRGNIQDIISFNFDSVLEWYLIINGLDVNVITKEQLLMRSADVNISHIHGYLPYDTKFGNNSDFLVFSQEEFEDRQVGKDYWKDHLYEFFRRHIFLTVGLSASSFDMDICPYLREMDKWYHAENIRRMYPYGIAFLTPEPDSYDKSEKLIKHGVIPCILEIDDIPNAIFEIVQSALTK